MSLDGKGAAVQKIGTLVQREEGEQEDTPEEAIIRETDARVGRIYESLPRDTLFVVCSCQGDTAKSRYAQVARLKPQHCISLSLETHLCLSQSIQATMEWPSTQD